MNPLTECQDKLSKVAASECWTTLPIVRGKSLLWQRGHFAERNSAKCTPRGQVNVAGDELN